MKKHEKEHEKHEKHEKMHKDKAHVPKKKHKKKHEKHKEEAKEHRSEKAMKHKDALGAGAKKRKKLPAKEKVGVVMREFKRGTLNSGSGAKVTNPKQAIAIGLSEARKAGANIPKKKK